MIKVYTCSGKSVKFIDIYMYNSEYAPKLTDSMIFYLKFTFILRFLGSSEGKKLDFC